LPKTRSMPFRLAPRVLVPVAVVFVLATATIALATQGQVVVPAPAPVPVAKPAVLTVPDVRNEAYVFAKGVLEDAGFAWRLGPGSAPGFAGYRVVSQFPAAGVHVIDTGAPTLVLRVARDPHYRPQGHQPEGSAPYRGTAIRLADAASAPVARPKAKPAVRIVRVAPKAKPVAKPKAVKPKAAKPKAKRAAAAVRTPAFVVPGAQKEPLDEMTLPARARLLRAWVGSHRDASSPNVQHWLYQHAWIVTGARFGWWHGDEALRILIGVDRTVERQWSLGAKSEAQAQSALDFVDSQR
jgi:hypothetical protein